MNNVRDKHWIPPDDMPSEQATRCLAGTMCGARLKQPSANGHRYCRRYPAPGQTGGFPHRCGRHGGAAGARRGNLNALRHGIYVCSVLPGEEEIYNAIPVGDLDSEIRITKLRLRRAFIAERQQHERLVSEDRAERVKVMEIESEDVQYEPPKTPDDKPKVVESKVTRRVRDYGRQIHDLITQLVKLENQRSLMLGGKELDAAERARLAREEMARMDAELDSSDI